MQGLFGVVTLLELLDCLRVFPAMSKGWADHKIGSFSLDPLSMTNERTTLAEIKNGRLAMMAFSGARRAPGLPRSRDRARDRAKTPLTPRPSSRRRPRSRAGLVTQSALTGHGFPYM